MSIVGLVVEYNPFHNGHLHHLLESKKISNSNYSVAVMSGNFLQRGEPALLDKWTRAKMAVDNGVDLVIELPFIFSCASAEFFSDGAVGILDSLGIVESLSFGSEAGEISILKNIADVLVDEPIGFKNYLKDFLDLGESFPKARSRALSKYFKESKHESFDLIESTVSSPNNILAIEYMKSLKKLDSKIKPFTVKRSSSNYHDKDIKGSIASATSIREDFFKNKTLGNIKSVVPQNTYKYLVEFLENNNNFNHIDHYEQNLLYLFRLVNYDKISYANDLNDDLYNRMLKSFNNSNRLEDILQEIKTKRYTMTRIKRILIHTLMNLNKSTFRELNSTGPRYIRVLAANKSGLELLSQVKLKSDLPIITKFSNYKKLNDNLLEDMIAFDKKSTDLYFTGLNPFSKRANMNLDFLTSPYIQDKHKK